ncbi:MAG: ribonuclease P protein component [Actinomycetota bacterium]
MGRGSIARSRDFRKVFDTGRRARRDGLTVWAVPAADPALASRLGLTVRRSTGNSVTRNRIKRRIRHAFAETLPVNGFDVVARADAEAIGRNYQELKDDLRRALAAAGVETRS